jgi:hypothetical protein
MEELRPARRPETEEKIPEIPTHEYIYTGGQVRLRQITLNYPSGAKASQKAKVLEQAKQAYKEAMTGADFARLAKKYSQDQWAKSGGDLGWMNYKDMARPIQKMVSRMKVGDLKPINTRQGIMIFYLANEKGRKTKKRRIPESVRQEQLKRLKELLKKREQLREQQRREALENAAAPDGQTNVSGASNGGKREKIKDLGILTPEETGEYRKARKKVFFILKARKTRERMKSWIASLKKNSIIDVRL